jgi:uncharacterized RDD family membrane protein YckC
MTWYYASGGQQQGPVDEAQFEALIQSGQIKPTDLVWKEGMANWQPLAAVKPASGVTPPPGEVPPVLGGTDIACAECGGIFPRDQAIQYGTTWVCAACKPKFVQKLKEGVAVGGVGTFPAVEGGLSYAGFWIRFAAKFIDNLIITAIFMIPTIALMIPFFQSASGGGPPPAMGLALQGLFQIGYVVVFVAFNTFFLGKYGATPGKMAVGVKVVMSDGATLTWGRAFGRAWADYLSSLICSIGYIIAAFDQEKRALHDHMCNTRVVFK